MAETEIDWIEDDEKIKKQTDINRHGPRPTSSDSQPPDPPPPLFFILHYRYNKILNYFGDSSLLVRCLMTSGGQRWRHRWLMDWRRRSTCWKENAARRNQNRYLCRFVISPVSLKIHSSYCWPKANFSDMSAKKFGHRSPSRFFKNEMNWQGAFRMTKYFRIGFYVLYFLWGAGRRVVITLQHKRVCLSSQLLTQGH